MKHKNCSVYDVCGGCSFQHLPTQAYKEHKITHFKNAFKNLILDNQIFQEPTFIPDQTRRRTTLSFYSDGKNFVWGYKQQKSHKIVPANDCIVVTPNILVAMQALSRFIESFIKPNIQIKASITEADNGLDISLKGIKPPKAKEASLFNQDFFQLIPKAIRLTIDTEIIAQTETPYITIGNIKVKLPLDVFLQPSQEGQEILISQVMQHLTKVTKKTKIIDLFCGIGTFTLPIAKECSVVAYDNATNSLNALKETRDKEGLDNRIIVHSRDLFRDAVSFLELNQYDIAIIDPPRAGAETQIKQLAKSKIKQIIYVFCDTDSAARDLLLLQNAGYALKSIKAIDQFVYSNHLEGIAVLVK